MAPTPASLGFRSSRHPGLIMLLALALAATVLAATASPASAAFVPVVDEGGQDDVPGNQAQRDLTQLAIDDVDPLLVQVNFDETTIGGANSLDGCFLLNTDDDRFVDGAVCVTLTDDGTGGLTLADDAVRVLTCAGEDEDNCRTPTEVANPGTDCWLAAGDDPFVNGPDDDDTAVTCEIDPADFGDSPELLNVCAYPSRSLTSAPADCIFVPREAQLTIVNQATPDAGTFPFTLNGTTVFTATGTETSDALLIRTDIGYDLSVTLPAGYQLDTAECTGADENGSEPTIVGSVVTITGIEADPNDEVVCTFASSNPLPTVDVMKTAVDTAPAGSSVTFTISVENTSDPDEAVTITSLFDDQLGELTTGGNTPPVTDTDCDDKSLEIPADGTFTCSVTATIDTPHTNIVTATVTEPGGRTNTDQDSHTVNAPGAPTITVVKTTDVDVVSVNGDNVLFTIEATNTSDRGVTVDSVIDTVFGNLLTRTDLTGTNCTTEDRVLAASGAGDDVFRCTFTARITADHDNVVTVTVVDSNNTPGQGSDDASVDLNVPPTVSVSKTALDDTVRSTGGTVRFDVTVTNTSGEPTIVESLVDSVYGDLLDELNEHPDLSNNTCPDQATGLPDTQFGTDTLGANQTLSCSFDAEITEDHTNTVTGTISDRIDDASATATATVDVNAAPTITVDKSVLPAGLPPEGGTPTFTVRITNTSGRELTLSELIDDPFGDLLDAENTAIGDNTCPDIERVIPTDHTVSCTFTAEITATHTDTVTAEVFDRLEESGQGSDSATVTVGQDPPPPPPPPPPGPRADLSTTKTADPAEASVGQPVTFTIGVTNDGPSTATGVTVTDDVPGALGITSVSTSQGTCEVDDQTVTCAIGNLTNGASATVTIVTEALSPGLLTNTAVASSPITDPDPANDSADADVTVIVLDVAGTCETAVGGGQLVAGPTRIETAIQASQLIFCDGEAAAVVLTRSDLFPDAQAGTPLAITEDAPLLLSQPDVLNPNTEAEILRVLQPGGTVYLLGGTAALSQAVEDRIVELGYQAVRYGGANRFETAVIIADQGLDNPSTLLVADGGEFADAVLAGAASLSPELPGPAAVILTSGVQIPPSTADYLAGRADSPTIIAIGTPAAAALPEAEAVTGTDRYATSVAVAERFFTAPPVVGLATGLNFADALAGGAIVGRPDIGPGPILLTDGTELTPAVATYLASLTGTTDGLIIFGGTAAISNEVRDDALAILGFL